MTEEIKSVRPRETMPALTFGGAEATKPAASLPEGLPFDPHDFIVRGGSLKEALAGIDQVATLNNMQAFDTRTTAAAEYERRIKELAVKAEEG